MTFDFNFYTTPYKSHASFNANNILVRPTERGFIYNFFGNKGSCSFLKGKIELK